MTGDQFAEKDEGEEIKRRIFLIFLKDTCSGKEDDLNKIFPTCSELRSVLSFKLAFREYNIPNDRYYYFLRDKDNELQEKETDRDYYYLNTMVSLLDKDSLPKEDEDAKKFSAKKTKLFFDYSKLSLSKKDIVGVFEELSISLFSGDLRESDKIIVHDVVDKLKGKLKELSEALIKFDEYILSMNVSKKPKRIKLSLPSIWDRIKCTVVVFLRHAFLPLLLFDLMQGQAKSRWAAAFNGYNNIHYYKAGKVFNECDEGLDEYRIETGNKNLELNKVFQKEIKEILDVLNGQGALNQLSLSTRQYDSSGDSQTEPRQETIPATNLASMFKK